jgi:hypothetical protein
VFDSDPDFGCAGAYKGKSPKMTKSQKLKYCAGCSNDFYNGRNPYGIKECWSLSDMKLGWRKEVHIDQIPPWTQKAGRFPMCYHRPHYVYVGKDQKYWSAGAQKMIDAEKFKIWLRNTNAIADQFERVRKDPMQHLTPKQIDDYLVDFFEETDKMLGTNFAERAREKWPTKTSLTNLFIAGVNAIAAVRRSDAF